MQQGLLRKMEVETSKARIPATRSNPTFEFGRILNERIESVKLFKNEISRAKMFGGKMPLSAAFENGKFEGTRQRKTAKLFWAENEKMPEREFYFHHILKAFLLQGHFSAAQLRDLRAYYEKAVSHPEVFTSDIAFADALSGCLGISFVGDAYLAEKITSLAKAAPEGKRFLTDFVVVRSLLNLERYDLVQELMDFRQAQEGWFRDGQLITEGETARVYEEVKLYKQTQKAIPVTFHEQLPARNKFIFSEADNRMDDFLEPRTWIVLFDSYKTTFRGKNRQHYSIEPEDSAFSLEYFLQYKHRDFTKKPQ